MALLGNKKATACPLPAANDRKQPQRKVAEIGAFSDQIAKSPISRKPPQGIQTFLSPETGVRIPVAVSTGPPLLSASSAAGSYAPAVNDFFEAPLPQPETCVEEAEGPVWFQPPRGVLPCAVPLAEVIARNDKVAIGIAGVLAYTTGFELKFIVILTRTAAQDLDLDLGMFDYRHRGGQRDGGLSPEMLRLGIEYSDGRKSMNTNPRWPDFEEDEEDESKPTMVEHGGGGVEREWRQSFWCWPLPSPGPLQLVCEWPSMEIPLTRHKVDANLILDAAERAQEIFPPD